MKLGQKHITKTKTGYDLSVPMLDNEVLQKLNKETGEVEDIELPVANKQTGKHSDLMIFEPDGLFVKEYSPGWDWLYLHTTALEYKVAGYLSHRAHPVTNSLKPLSDGTTQRELAAILRISLGKVSVTINRLFELGVFGKFEVHADKEYKKYWLFNPYLTFRGKYLHQSVWELFKDTNIAKVYYMDKNLPCPDC